MLSYIFSSTQFFVKSSQMKYRKISTIKDSAGKPTNSPQGRNNTFRNFYTKLYSSEKDPRQDIDLFFQNINLPKLDAEQVNMLDSPITEKELSTALFSCRTTKHQALMASLLSSTNTFGPL